VRSRGVFYIAISALGFSAMSVLVKVCSETLPTGLKVVVGHKDA